MNKRHFRKSGRTAFKVGFFVVTELFYNILKLKITMQSKPFLSESQYSLIKYSLNMYSDTPF